MIPTGISREEHRAEHGLQLQVSGTIEHEAVSPISGGKAQRVKAPAAVHPAISGGHGDDSMVVEEPVKFRRPSDHGVMRRFVRPVEWRGFTRTSSKFDMHEDFSSARFGT